MSSPILPIQGPSGHLSPTPEASAAMRDVASFVAELAATDRNLTIDAARATPPPEVLEQMAAAAQVSEQLRQEGHELRFHARPGRVAIELCDTAGSAIRTVSTLEAFEIAAVPQGS